MKSPLNDTVLVAQAMLGNKRAFETLVLHHQSSVRRFLTHLCDGDRMLADDLSQDTFLKAYTNIRSFKGLSGFSSWLFRIAYNVFYDYIRSHKPTDDLDTARGAALYATDPNPDRVIDIHRALQQLNGEMKTAVVLYYMEDRKVEEVAEVMNCPVGTVKSYLMRGREKLSDFLIQSGYGADH